MAEKICAYCGKKFNSNKHFKKYCSKECFKKSRGCYFPAKSLIKKCEVCGKEFVAHTYKQKFCSKKCKWKGGGIWQKKCIVCGKIFAASHPKVKYCSSECFAFDSNKPSQSNRARKILICRL